jgi:hypothetical protein
MTPTRHFVERGQDGLGLFGHLADVSGGASLVWARMLPMISIALANSDLDAFQYLIAGYQPQYFMTWGPSYFLDATKPDWRMSSPGQPPTQMHAPLEITVNAGDEKIFPEVGHYEAGTVKLSSNADILVFGAATGYGRLHDEKFGLDKLFADTTVPMCLKPGGCTCPDGSAGASLITKPAKAPIYIGLAGADGIACRGAVAKILTGSARSLKIRRLRPSVLVVRVAGVMAVPSPKRSGPTTVRAWATRTSPRSMESATTSRSSASTRLFDRRRTILPCRFARCRRSSREPSR